MSDQNEDKVRPLHLNVEHVLESFRLRLEHMDGVGAVLAGQGAFFSPSPEELRRLAGSLRRMATLAERLADMGQVGEPNDGASAGVAYPAASVHFSQVIRLEAVLRQGGMWFALAKPEGLVEVVAMCRENLPAVVDELLAMAHFIRSNLERVLPAKELQEEMEKNPPEGYEQQDMPLERRLELVKADK